MKIHLDFETRSEVDIKKVGAWAYAKHPSTEIMCMGFGANADRIQVLGHEINWRNLKIPGLEKDLISAHSAQFEYAIYNYILHERYGWPAKWDPKLWSCTMAKAAMCGLPLDLDNLGRVLKIKSPKDLEGRRVMLRLCKPIGLDPLSDPIYDNDPKKFKRLCDYNAGDVMAEMEIDGLLPDLPPYERAIWELDLLINRRGVCVDTEFAAAAGRMAGLLTQDLNKQLQEMTKGFVDKATRVARIKDYLKHNGLEVLSLDKAAVSAILADPTVSNHIKEVLSIRRQVGKSSTAKYKKTIETADPKDHRVRGALQYHAAHTGRWGGRLIQPQNYPKGFSDEADQARVIDLIKYGSLPVFSLIYGDTAMSALSDTLRGTIVAARGKKLVCADYNAIEARVLFWLAGDQSALMTYNRI